MERVLNLILLYQKSLNLLASKTQNIRAIYLEHYIWDANQLIN